MQANEFDAQIAPIQPALCKRARPSARRTPLTKAPGRFYPPLAAQSRPWGATPGMPLTRLIKVIAVVTAMICVGCTSNSTLQQRCSEGEQAACDQLTHAQQGSGPYPDRSRAPV